MTRHLKRIWFYRPEAWWYGWRTLIPFMIGHDENARYTVVIGWNFSGRMIIALWPCRDPLCQEEALDT